MANRRFGTGVSVGQSRGRSVVSFRRVSKKTLREITQKTSQLVKKDIAKTKAKAKISKSRSSKGSRNINKL